MKNEVSLWWRQYPRSGCPEPQLQARLPKQQSEFEIGTVVRLKGKPDKPRRVLAVEWHNYCGAFVYIVETSAPAQFKYVPYWFASQLVSEAQWQRQQQAEGYQT